MEELGWLGNAVAGLLTVAVIVNLVVRVAAGGSCPDL